MFLTCWSPGSSELSGTRSRTCSNTALGVEHDRSAVKLPMTLIRFAMDSLLEGDGFEPSVPRQKDV